jgi:hypothetical protein
MSVAVVWHRLWPGRAEVVLQHQALLKGHRLRLKRWQMVQQLGVLQR